MKCKKLPRLIPRQKVFGCILAIFVDFLVDYRSTVTYVTTLRRESKSNQKGHTKSTPTDYGLQQELFALIKGHSILIGTWLSIHAFMSNPVAIFGSGSDVVVAQPLTLAFSNLPSNPHAVGAAWLVLSAVFTTYSTTKFLSFGDDSIVMRQRIEKATLPLHHSQRQPTRFIQRFMRLPLPNLLTLYRFSGSLLLGLLVHPDLAIWSRLKHTLQLIPSVAFPAFFLFVANFANSYVKLDDVVNAIEIEKNIYFDPNKSIQLVLSYLLIV